jgi:adenylate cyclase
MAETRKIVAILVSDVVGYSRLAGADEDRILARLRTLRSDLIDPLISVHHGRIVKRTGDGSIIEFRSVVEAVRLAIEVQSSMVERNAEVQVDRRILFRMAFISAMCMACNPHNENRDHEFGPIRRAIFRQLHPFASVICGD